MGSYLPGHEHRGVDRRAVIGVDDRGFGGRVAGPAAAALAARANAADCARGGVPDLVQLLLEADRAGGAVLSGAILASCRPRSPAEANDVALSYKTAEARIG